MDAQFSFPSWFVANWPRAALPAAAIISLSLPSLLVPDNQRLVLVYALLPLYMIHQYEEHAQGRFAAHYNATMGQNLPVLTTVSIFWINVGLIWGSFLVAFALTRYVSPAFIFIPIYVTLLNALTHLAESLRARNYTPGVLTSVLLFIPWGIVCLIVTTQAAREPLRDNLIGIAGGVIFHAIILVYTIVRRRALSSQSAV